MLWLPIDSFYQAKKYTDHLQVWREDEAKLMRGHIAIMILEDKLGSDKALKQFKKVVERYYAGHEVQIVGSKSDQLNLTWHMYIISLL